METVPESYHRVLSDRNRQEDEVLPLEPSRLGRTREGRRNYGVSPRTLTNPLRWKEGPFSPSKGEETVTLSPSERRTTKVHQTPQGSELRAPK